MIENYLHYKLEFHYFTIKSSSLPPPPHSLPPPLLQTDQPILLILLTGGKENMDGNGNQMGILNVPFLPDNWQHKTNRTVFWAHIFSWGLRIWNLNSFAQCKNFGRESRRKCTVYLAPLSCTWAARTKKLNSGDTISSSWNTTKTCNTFETPAPHPQFLPAYRLGDKWDWSSLRAFVNGCGEGGHSLSFLLLCVF